MTTLIAVFVAAAVTTALCAVFIGPRALLPVFVSALGVAFAARAMWFFGLYAAVIPNALERGTVMPMAAPVAAAVLYGGWFIARSRSSRAGRTVFSVRLRRFALLGVAALAAIATVAVSMRIDVARGEWTASGESDAAVIPLLVMLVPSLFSYAWDRDAELALLMAAVGLFATVPIVIIGRLSYVLIAKVLYEVVS